MENKFKPEITQDVIDLVNDKLSSVPEKYRTTLSSNHEGYALLLEEVRELEQEIFFGEKKAIAEFPTRATMAEFRHKSHIRAEAVDIMAMCVRIIQELT